MNIHDLPHSEQEFSTPAEWHTFLSWCQASYDTVKRAPTEEECEDAGMCPDYVVFKKPYRLSEILDLPMPIDLVKGMLPDVGVAILSAGSGAGKSWFANELCARLASDKPLGDFTFPKGPQNCIYVSGEERGAGLFRRAIAASEISLWINDHYAICDGVKFKANDYGAMKVELEWIVESMRWQDVGLIVLDTLTRLGGAENENDAPEANLIMENAMNIAEHFQCCVLLLTHLAKQDIRMGAVDDPSSYVRGSSAYSGAADTMIHLAYLPTEKNASADEKYEARHGPNARRLIRVIKSRVGTRKKDVEIRFKEQRTEDGLTYRQYEVISEEELKRDEQRREDIKKNNTMQRMLKIKELLNDFGEMSVKELSDKLEVTPQTVRNWASELYKDGYIGQRQDGNKLVYGVLAEE